ncbi:MAG: transposase [Blastocatellia bacterium]|nr:transposase [Blastocatellia bacterium]
MKRAFKYKIKPSKAVERKLDATLDTCRELYNAAIEERRSAFNTSHTCITYKNQQNQLPDIKKIRPDLVYIHSQVLQDVLKRVQLAFEAFFRRVREGDNPGYPRFKSKDRYHSFTYPQSGFKLEGNKLWLSKLGTMQLAMTREVCGTVKTVTIKREGKDWFVIFTCETEAQPQAATGRVKAIDVGLEYFFVDQDGQVEENPRFYRKSEKKLAHAQKRLSRKKKYSKHWKQAKEKVARIHRKIANQRKDFLHKLSTRIIKENDIIFFEDLNISGMMRNHCLAKSIADASWGMFLWMLVYKAEGAGKRALNVNPNGTSQICSGCGNRVPKGLSERWHRCPYCGLELQRDHNSAKVIYARGIELLPAVGQTEVARGGLGVPESEKRESVKGCEDDKSSLPSHS